MQVFLSYIDQLDKAALMRDLRLERAIKGFRFEFQLQDILTDETIELSCIRPGNKIARNRMFSVKNTVSLVTKLTETLTDGTVYFLRPSHRVIDAVGVFSEVLLLIQISLQEYDQHASKAHNLWDNMPTEVGVPRLL